MDKRINTNPHIQDFNLKRYKNFPNNHLPVLIYRKAIDLPDQKNKSTEIIRKIFAKNGWRNSWRNGIYDFHHYHSITHEGMAISNGSSKVILGGPNGKRLNLKKGDVIIIPAGVAHKCISASKDFLCVGAYPQGKDYDINIGSLSEYKKALSRIRKLGIPKKDP